MANRNFDAAIERSVVSRHRALGQAIQQFREDAGLSRAAVARAAGIDDAYLGRIEDGKERPSIETYVRIGTVLGVDLSLRFYTNTGPTIRDRLSAPMTEALLGILDRRWQRFTEVGVHKPSRGWIDAALFDPRGAVILATELQSELRRLEQMIRWHAEKAESLPSWRGWPALGQTPAVSQLMIVRRTRATRQTVREFGEQLRVAYPAHPDDALEALRTPNAPWPGAAMLWAEVDGSRARVLGGR